MTKNILEGNLRLIIKSDEVLAFLTGTATAVMLLFTVIAIRSHGIFEIDMTAYGEYWYEIFILIVWFVLLIFRIRK
jgi:hypothetical protein